MQKNTDILVGRKGEINRLKSIMDSNEAEFVVVYGRRRVGKTFLVNTFFKDNYTFKLTGLAKKSKSEQLSNFAAALNRYGKKNTQSLALGLKPLKAYALFWKTPKLLAKESCLSMNCLGLIPKGAIWCRRWSIFGTIGLQRKTILC